MKSRITGVLVTLVALFGAALVAPSTAAATATPAAAAATGRAKFSPAHYTPPVGPKFNDPYGGKTARRTILRHVRRTIDSVRGYRVHDPRNCPSDPAKYPGEIRISLYSIADMGFVDSLAAANRRCISVQVLMNDHLNVSNSPSWRRLVHALGSNRGARSFAYTCHHSCRGNSVLHSKFYLFSQAGHARDVVMVGSSNMTTNASGVQWNDLLTVDGNQKMYDDYSSIFRQMVPDHRWKSPLRIFQEGRYTSTFYPQPGANANTDQAMKLLRSIHCTGAQGGAGQGGHTLVDIDMHAWSHPRGHYLAQQVHRMYDQGCIIRVLYSFMWHSTYLTLKNGTGPRMEVRRTAFPRPGTNIAAHYSHMKTIAVSGNVGDDPSSWVVWTGSDNFTNLGVYSDEVTLRAPSKWLWGKYRAHFDYIRNHHSSPVWAIYPEPAGGGRAPD